MNVSSPVPYVKQQLIYLLYGERRIYQLEAKLSILTAVARCNPAELPVIRVAYRPTTGLCRLAGGSDHAG
ncbi:hypothetical protein LU684_27755 [Pseudomonas sp. NMI542_15]|nr:MULTISPECIES: hypothetical protein [Pseudomonas]MCE0782455.1 hypothetical protein [Pseudomonas sp. NMI542_15]